jgi:hypothetical protein
MMFLMLSESPSPRVTISAIANHVYSVLHLEGHRERAILAVFLVADTSLGVKYRLRLVSNSYMQYSGEHLNCHHD